MNGALPWCRPSPRSYKSLAAGCICSLGQGRASCCRTPPYAGIQNALFYDENCNMVYGDATAVLTKMIEAVRA